MELTPNQAALGADSTEIPAEVDDIGLPGTVCLLCEVQIKDNGACKGQCKFGKVRKLDGVPSCLYLLLSDSPICVPAVATAKAAQSRDQLVREALLAAKKKGLDSVATGFLTAMPAGIGRLDALGNATTR